MTRHENELDEFGRKSLAPLRPTPPLEQGIYVEERARFLHKAESLQNTVIPTQAKVQSLQADRKRGNLRGWLSLPLYKALVAMFLVLVLVAGSSITVYAAQSSLPGDPLYTLKSASEDIRILMTFSPKSKLDLTLDFTNRRVNEIQTLVSDGKPLTEQTSDRYQNELEDALLLASQMNDAQIQQALNEIKAQAESQGITMDELIAKLPEHASPAIIRLKERLQEQVQISTIGEKNPQAFRNQIKERAQNRHGPKGKPTSELPEILPLLSTITPKPNQNKDKNGDEVIEPTDVPDHGNQGNGQGQSGPGNGNHGPNPTHTP